MNRSSLVTIADRTARLLFGMALPRVFEHLAGYGLRRADLEEGWALLKDAMLPPDAAIDTAPANADLIAALDAWEDRWYPVIEATLARRFPEIRESIFYGLSQSEGPAVVLSVLTLVDRIDGLNRNRGHIEQAAALRLQQRGLTPDVLESARKIIATIAEPSSAATEPVPPGPSVNATPSASVREETLRAYYYEWSSIARVAIRDKGTLRQLGLVGKGPRGERPDETCPPTQVVPAPAPFDAPAVKPRNPFEAPASELRNPFALPSEGT
jgi:hypothetical protein